MVTALGHISGGHFNPAVTLGFVLTRRMKPVLGACYWVARFSGAVAAALLLKWIYPDNVTDAAKLGAPVLNDQISASGGFVLEAILTFFLVWVVFATAADPRGAFTAIAGFAIGLTIAGRHPHRRPAHRRRHEPGSCPRADARPEPVGGRLDLVPRPIPRRRARCARLRDALPQPGAAATAAGNARLRG